MASVRPDMGRRIVVVGNGMVGHRFVEDAVDLGLHHDCELVVIGEEARLAYDRVHLSSLFDGSAADDLALSTSEWYAEHGIDLRLNGCVVRIDREARVAHLADGSSVAYDHLVLATGSFPFVPPIEGKDTPGTFVYRTIEDLEAMADYAAGCRTGIVVGGGLLGLEAANALRLLGLKTTVVEFAPRLMSLQLDEAGAKLLQRKIEALGIDVRCSHGAKAVHACPDRGVVTGLAFGDDSVLEGDMVVFSAGVRPRDDVGRESELQMGERGGVVVDDLCITSDPAISAIGEVACHRGRVYGLVAPGYRMARVAAARLSGDATAVFEGASLDAKLKLVGVDVASFGDAHAVTPGSEELVYSDPRAGTYAKLVLSGPKHQIVGGVLVGDTSQFAVLSEMARGVVPTPRKPESLILPAVAGAAKLTVTSLPDAAMICSCHNVTKGQICSAVRDNDLCDVAGVKACTAAGTGCGSCVVALKELVNGELLAAGKTVSSAMCEHFTQSRQELFDLLRVEQIRSFRELIVRHGTGMGCEICKPAVASMLASWDPGYILDGEQASLQDTNDYVLANIQRDGTYSVVPRIPGGEVTPEKLIAIGEVARDFDLYTKITGGQRVDLFGARIDQLPEIWKRLIDAGFESGHAYGKALRTVKSCVGSTWCRYGVQDSVGLAVRIELRYRGLRSPHKLKSAVSGCARECAEAQSKDFGIIATERGYNLYLCGNGGMRPQHAVLFAEDLDEATLIAYLDRFLMFYIRTADRLERTATWFAKRDGGIDELREILIEDSLGICGDLEAAMALHVERYACEWAETLADPARLARFRPFVNSDVVDDSAVYIRERGQRRPAYEHELLELVGPPRDGERS
jgi:nitrite reductase (NADH) large subunit